MRIDRLYTKDRILSAPVGHAFHMFALHFWACLSLCVCGPPSDPFVAKWIELCFAPTRLLHTHTHGSIYNIIQSSVCVTRSTTSSSFLSDERERRIKRGWPFSYFFLESPLPRFSFLYYYFSFKLFSGSTNRVV